MTMSRMCLVLASVSLDCSSYCSEISELFEDATPVWFDGEYVDVELDNVVDLVTVHPDIGMMSTFCNSG